MPKQTTTYQCLLISPGDVPTERNAVVKAIEQWNATIGVQLHAHVIVRRWELALPEMGAPPQTIINRQLVDECDFGIAIFWARLGSPTKEHPSGSAEEVERLLAKGANVMVYFSSAPIPQDLLRDDQFSKLQALKKSYQERGLYVMYPTVDKLVEMVTLHINGLVNAFVIKERANNQPIPSTGTLVAPRPDIRVLVQAGMAFQGTAKTNVLGIEVQNHSPIEFYFRAACISCSDGTKIFLQRDGLTGEYLTPRTIASGNNLSIHVDTTATLRQLKRGVTMTNAIITDKIDRVFTSDQTRFQEELQSDAVNRGLKV